MTESDPWGDFAEERAKSQRCSFAKLLDRLPPERLEMLERALAAPREEMSTDGIHRVIRSKWGLVVSRETVRHHRAGQCICRKN